MRFIVAHVPFGWLIRSVHAWAANLMVGAAFAHLFSVFFLKAYRAPRELTWMSGCLLMALTLAFGFSGYLLPWNELALFATKVGTDIVGATPVVGHWIRFVLRGGEDVSGATLTRFFGFHVALLPLLVTFLLLVHFALVQVHGISEPIGAPKTARHMPFYPHFVLRELLVWLGDAGGAGRARHLPAVGARPQGRSVRLGAGRHPPGVVLHLHVADPQVPAADDRRDRRRARGDPRLRRPWRSLLFAVPFLDRRAARGLPSPLVSVGGAVVLVFALTMTLLAYLRPY